MRIGILVGALCLITLSATAQVQPTMPTEPPLITHAHLIIHTPQWIDPGYVWLNNSTLLVFEGTLPRQDDEIGTDYTFNYYQMITEEAVKSKPLLHATKVNARTGQTQPFVAFNTRYTDPAFVLFIFKPSPDGKWLLFKRAYRPQHWPLKPYPWELARLDGRSWREVAEDSSLGATQGNPVWTRDSRHWVKLGSTDGHMQCSVFSLAAPGPLRMVAFPTWPKPTLVPYTLCWFMGVRADGRLLARLRVFPDQRPPLEPPIEFIDFGLETTAAPPHHVTITPPRCRLVNDVVLSPDGRKLAWLVTGEDITHLDHPYGSHYEDYRTPFLGTKELWVSQVDGTRMKRLGWLLTNFPRLSFHDEAEVYELRWTPDNKHLSFIYGDGIYTVPVELGRGSQAQ